MTMHCDKTAMTFFKLRAGALVAALMLAVTAGCSSLIPEKAGEPKYYSLDYTGKPPATISAAADGPVILVLPTRGAPGFDQARMAYVRQAHQIEYFAENQWVEAPARMLTPMLVSALERSGGFRAVLAAPSAGMGQVRLSTEIVRLQQEFMGAPSKVRFTLRARLIEDGTRSVIATREFEAVADAPSENPYGGVQAANVAVSKVMDELAQFCVQNTRGLKPLAGR